MKELEWAFSGALFLFFTVHFDLFCDDLAVAGVFAAKSKLLSPAWNTLSSWEQIEKTSCITIWKHLYVIAGWITSRWNSGISNLLRVPDWYAVCTLGCSLICTVSVCAQGNRRMQSSRQCCNKILNKILHDFSFDEIPSSYDRRRTKNRGEQ